MRRIQNMLKQKASETKIPLWIIEKDYAISYLLAGISEVPILCDLLVLKGGTALKKTYFQKFRFSEDLDFSTCSHHNDSEMKEGIVRAANIMEKLLMERGPFSVQSSLLELRLPHPKRQIAYIIRVQFPYQREAICRLKVEITVDEPVFLPPETRLVLHDYDEAINTKTKVYQLSEIVAEKYRALLQSLERLRKKGWGASRVCRDYYDLWWVLGEVELNNYDIPSLTDKKCEVRSVAYNHPDTFFDDALVEVAQKEWNKILTPFIPKQVPVDKVLAELKYFTQQLWQ